MNSKMKNKMNIYVLKLKSDKYYIGKSKCVIDRLMEHKSGSGAKWTKLHKVIDIIAVYTNCDPFDEDKYVKKYMLEYGIDNVRGGSYSQVIITDEQYNLLERELHHSQDRCLECGSSDHYAKDCFLSKKKPIVCAICGRGGHYSLYCPTLDIEEIPLEQSNVICKRCQRNDHLAINCVAARDINGRRLVCQICKKIGHSKRQCRYKN